LQAAGGTLYGVSVDAVEDSRRVVEKQKLPFDLLCDPDAKVIRQYGLMHHEQFHDKDVSLPAHFLIDQDGRIAWSWIAGRVQDRADPEAVGEQVAKLVSE
jgi:peroxiredoxin Q/BCP